MTRSIVITSGKGGVGKTTVCANLGRMLAFLGFRVLLIDTDMGLNNLDVALGLEGKIVFDIVDVISGKCRLKQALIEDVVPGVFLLPSSHSYDKSNVTAASIKTLIDSLIGFDFCLVDCPAGIELGFHRAVSACQDAVVVTTPHLSALKDAGKVVDILRFYKLRPSLVLNRVRGDLVVSEDMIAPEDLSGIISAPLKGVLPEDDSVGLSNGKRLKAGSEAFKAYQMLAKSIAGGSTAIYDVTKRYRGLFGRIRMASKKRG